MRFLYLAGGALLSLFAINARWDVALAAWLVNVLLLRFTRESRWWVAWLGIWPVMALDVIAWLWHAELSSPALFAIAGVLSLAFTLPYLADRLLTPGLRRWTLLSTLVFPLGKVVVEFAVSTATPVGGLYGVLGATQYGNLPLAQLSSVTGIYGVTFVVAWFGSVAVTCWERRPVRTTVVTYVGVLAVVLAAGGARLAVDAPGDRTVRVAGVAPSPGAWRQTIDGIAPYDSVEEMNAADPDVLRRAFNHVVDDLLARTAREADAGARLVAWPESAVVTMQRDEPALLARFREFARQQDIYLSVGMTVYTASEPYVDNQSVLIGPDGSQVWAYRKAHPIPVLEPYEPGDGVVPTADTPYGRLSAVICFDAYFPALLRQGGEKRVDVMLVPSNDWRGIASPNARTARFRAIENGYTIVRPAMEGTSEVVDPRGRVLASTDYFRSGDDPTVVAYVPMRGTRTVYGTVGDVFAWLCVASLLALTAVGLRRRPGRSQPASEPPRATPPPSSTAVRSREPFGRG